MTKRPANMCRGCFEVRGVGEHTTVATVGDRVCLADDHVAIIGESVDGFLVRWAPDPLGEVATALGAHDHAVGGSFPCSADGSGNVRFGTPNGFTQFVLQRDEDFEQPVDLDVPAKLRRCWACLRDALAASSNPRINDLVDARTSYSLKVCKLQLANAQHPSLPNACR